MTSETSSRTAPPSASKTAAHNNAPIHPEVDPWDPWLSMNKAAKVRRRPPGALERRFPAAFHKVDGFAGFWAGRIDLVSMAMFMSVINVMGLAWMFFGAPPWTMWLEVVGLHVAVVAGCVVWTVSRYTRVRRQPLPESHGIG